MKKVLLIVILLFSMSLLTSCSKDKKTYTCFEYTDSTKLKGIEQFTTVDMLKDTYKEIKLVLNYKDHTFIRTGKFKEDIADEVHTGTFIEEENKLIFSYDNALKQYFETEWGKEEYVFVGKELHMRLERGTTAPSGNVYGPLVMKYK